MLGSNLGDRLHHLNLAKKHLTDKIGGITKSSSVYETDPWGIEKQPVFYNQVVEIDSELSPESMLSEINEIEQEIGRVRYQKWGSRIIDIDILYYGEVKIATDQLQIPHLENQNRRFVLEPICEIAPDFLHPVFQISQKELLKKCHDTLAVRKLNTKKAGPKS